MEEQYAALKHLSVLCVEDEEGIRNRVMNTLGYYFAHVYGAGDGEEGYALYKEKKPDVIISDIHMFGGSGIALVEKIRQHDSKTPIVMLSAYSREEYLMELINLRIDHFILKPANAGRLLEGISKALGEKMQGKLSLCQDVMLAPSERKLYYKGGIVSLSKRENTFLQLLYAQQLKTTTYAMLEEALWEDKYMSMEALKTFIKELRKKVAIDFLENVPQEGYRLKF